MWFGTVLVICAIWALLNPDKGSKLDFIMNGLAAILPIVVAICSVSGKKRNSLIQKASAKIKRSIWELCTKNGVNDSITGLFDPSKTSEFKVPVSKRRQNELAQSLWNDAAQHLSRANEMQDALSFALFYEEAIEELENLTQLKKATLGFDPAIYLKVVKDEFQWHFCDAIVRAKEATLENINEKYKNSREFQEREVQKFEENIGRCRRRFTPGTAELADKCVSEVRASIHKKQDSSTRTQRGIADIDGMEGHDFEYWCAGLLKNNGFSNVEVTRGSGDQGVDIVAEKGGIKYAIQCKCYSSDLGNKPVQEVAAGKSFYHCQVGAVMTNRYFTAGAKELANANGILLWDRDALSAMLDNV